MKSNSSIEQQREILIGMQLEGLNVCTCGDCGGVILFDFKSYDYDLEKIECPHCNTVQNYSDCPDLYN